MTKRSQGTASFSVIDGSARERRRQRRETRKGAAQRAREAAPKQSYSSDDGFPVRSWNWGGERKPRTGWGSRMLRLGGVKVAAHTAATAFPFVAGPSLGTAGVPIGQDLYGGGQICFDPWELYKAGRISGMSMLLFGTVGMGKSSLAKSLCIRLVLAGRKLAVASDLKGEWTEIVRTLGGPVIQVGPGLPTRLNPLDEGVRPSKDQQGNPMSDDAWHQVVRSRRMSIMETIIKILIKEDTLSPAQHTALEDSIDWAANLADTESRTPTIMDVMEGLKHAQKHDYKRVADAAEELVLVMRRVVSGGLAGMFDGESTVDFAEDAPAVSIDTSSMRTAREEARRMVSACCAAWMESMVTTSDGGQRIVVYEEGWDSMSSRADLQRMVENWKLSRAYGIFNILILHKVSDLNMAGDQGSQMAAMARSLLADADVKVIYRQDAAALKLTMEELDLSSREREVLKVLPKGQGLWRVGRDTFHIYNELTPAEEPLLDTDSRMDKTPAEESSGDESETEPVAEWLGA